MKQNVEVFVMGGVDSSGANDDALRVYGVSIFGIPASDIVSGP